MLNENIMATKTKENMVKLKCVECKEINYYTSRNKKKIKEKLELSKFCNKCRKHTEHKEMK
jgi:large subunit ribosomal protein L33